MSGKKVEIELYTMDPARQEMTQVTGSVAELELGGKYLVHLDGPHLTQELAEALGKKLRDMGIEAVVLAAPEFTVRVWKVGVDSAGERP